MSECREIGLAKLYLADSRVLQLEMSDYAIVTDPVWPNAPDDMFDLDVSPRQLLAGVLEKYHGARRVVVILRFDSDPRFLTAVSDQWPFFRVMVLNYAIPGYVGRKLGGLELAYWFGEPVRSVAGRRVIPGISPRAQPGRRGLHPCARNIHHMRWLVKWCADFEDVVFDPFMGAGTIGVAAVEQGKRFVGVEINPDYFEVACQRIEEAQQQQKIPLEMIGG